MNFARFWPSAYRSLEFGLLDKGFKLFLLHFGLFISLDWSSGWCCRPRCWWCWWRCWQVFGAIWPHTLGTASFLRRRYLSGALAVFRCLLISFLESFARIHFWRSSGSLGTAWKETDFGVFSPVYPDRQPCPEHVVGISKTNKKSYSIDGKMWPGHAVGGWVQYCSRPTIGDSARSLRLVNANLW